MKSLIEHVQITRPDVVWLKGPDEVGNYEWPEGLPNEPEIEALIGSYTTDQPSSILPKINQYLVKSKALHSIDHNVDLTITTRVRETFGQTNTDRGLLIRKEYFTDDALLNRLFLIDYEYQKDAYGYLTHQKVVLTWDNEDGSLNPNVKDKGFTKYSASESRNATKKRREACVYLLEGNLINLLLQAPGGASNLTMGADFMNAASLYTTKFLNSGVITELATFLADSATVTAFPFLAMEVAPGVSVSTYILSGLTYD